MVLGVYNIKGGVGKTATSVNLAYLGAKNGFKTLIWDLDPQGASTFYFRVKNKIKGSTKKLISKKNEIFSESIKETDFENLDIMPSTFSYRYFDILLSNQKKSQKILSALLKPMIDEYDLIILDSPPNLTLIAENIFKASDLLLVPTIPTTLSIRTYNQLLEFLDEHKIDTKITTFFSMVDKNRKLHDKVIDVLEKESDNILKTRIPYSADIENMGIYRMPVGGFNEKCEAYYAYIELFKELMEKFDIVK